MAGVMSARRACNGRIHPPLPPTDESRRRNRAKNSEISDNLGAEIGLKNREIPAQESSGVVGMHMVRVRIGESERD